MSKIIAVKLTPKAAANRVGAARQLPDGTEQLAVYVTAPPEDGKANAALLSLLAEHWGVPISRLSIKRGQTARHKLVQLD